MRRQVYARGQIIYYKGDPADKVMFLKDGVVKLVAPGNSSAEFIHSFLSGPALLGGAAVFDGGPHEVGAQVLTRSTCIAVPRQAFAALERDSDFLWLKLVIATSRLREGINRVEEVLFYTPEQRIALRLLKMDELRIGLTEGEIAEAIGVTRETVSKWISGAREKEVIVDRGVRIVNNDRAKAVISLVAGGLSLATARRRVAEAGRKS